jgi:hypothetical protein
MNRKRVKALRKWKNEKEISSYCSSENELRKELGSIAVSFELLISPRELQRQEFDKLHISNVDDKAIILSFHRNCSNQLFTPAV